MYQQRAFSLHRDLAPNHNLVRTPEELERMERALRGKDLVFDFETNGLAWYHHARACGLALGAYDGDVFNAWYVPFRHQTGEQQLPTELVSRVAKPLLADPATMKIAHNMKFDEHIARREGWTVNGKRYDTFVAARLHDENIPGGLKYRAKVELGRAEEVEWEADLNLELKRLAREQGMGINSYKDRYGYAQIMVGMAAGYGCWDVQFCGELVRYYDRHGVRERHSLIWDNEMELQRFLTKMEQTGLLVDVDYLEGLRQRVGDKLVDLEAVIFQHVPRFNLSSDAELMRFLQSVGYRPWKLTRSKKYACDRDVLKDAVNCMPHVIGPILEWREFEKIRSTYTDSILNRLDEHQYVHPDFQQMGATSGRLSCSKPNFQNFFNDDKDRKKANDGVDPYSIKRAFITPEGKVRLFYDYGQVELRVIAHYTQDPIMVKAFQDGEDIHERTSLELFGSTEDGMRRKAKVANFGVCIAEGSLVLTDQGLVPIEDVTVDQRVWDGVEWVTHEGVICNGEQEVVTYDGVTATPDHEVYTRDGYRTKIGCLASCVGGGQLGVGEIGGSPVGYVAFDRRNSATSVWAPGSTCPSGESCLYCMREDQMVSGVQPQTRINQELSVPTGEVQGSPRPHLGTTLRRYGAALLSRYARFVTQLQRPGNQSLVSFPRALRPVGLGDVSEFGFQGLGFRQNRQRWALLPGQFTSGRSICQSKKQTVRVYDIMNAGPRHRFTVSGKVVSNSYGLSAIGASRQLGISVEEAESFMTAFYKRYASIDRFRVDFWNFARSQGNTFTNMYGRRRTIDDLGNFKDDRSRGRAERRAMGCLIQGTAAELTRYSIVRVGQYLEANSLPVDIVNTVHDEIQLDSPIELMPEITAPIKKVMTAFPEFHNVPILVDGEYSVTSWNEKQDIPGFAHL